MRENAWAPEDEEFLRHWYTQAPLADLAAFLGRTPCAVKTRAKVLGVRRREWWTSREMATLRAEYGRTPTPELARRMGRPVGQVHRQAAKHGLCFQSRLDVTAGVLDTIRRLNAEGGTDTEIAAALGCERHTVSRHRKRMGLPSHEKGEHWRRSITEAARRQLERAGLSSLGQLRARVLRDRVRASGWPEDLRVRHVQILDLLLARGPMTRPEIVAALGMRWRGSRNSLKSNDPEGTYLAHLIRRGLVARARRARRVTGRGRGHSLDLYLVPLWAWTVRKETTPCDKSR